MAPIYPLATSSWDQAEYDALNRVIASGQFTMGSEVRAFEGTVCTSIWLKVCPDGEFRIICKSVDHGCSEVYTKR